MDPGKALHFHCRACGERFEAEPTRTVPVADRKWQPVDYFAACPLCSAEAAQLGWELGLAKAWTLAAGPKTAAGIQKYHLRFTRVPFEGSMINPINQSVRELSRRQHHSVGMPLRFDEPVPIRSRPRVPCLYVGLVVVCRHPWHSRSSNSPIPRMGSTDTSFEALGLYLRQDQRKRVSRPKRSIFGGASNETSRGPFVDVRESDPLRRRRGHQTSRPCLRRTLRAPEFPRLRWRSAEIRSPGHSELHRLGEFDHPGSLRLPFARRESGCVAATASANPKSAQPMGRNQLSRGDSNANS